VEVTEIADPGVTGNLEVTVPATGFELHMKVKSDQGMIDSADKWAAFYKKLDEAVASAPNEDWESKLKKYDAKAWMKLVGARRTAGQPGCYPWPTNLASRTYANGGAPVASSMKIVAPAPAPAPAPAAAACGPGG
jgi:hypothetical protein